MNRHPQPQTNETGTRYSQFAPSPELAPYVACFWTVTSGQGQAASRIRVLPDGCMDAIFDLTGGLVPLGAAGKVKSRPTAFITGASITPAVIALPRSPKIIGIRFKPGGAVPFMNVPARKLSETSTALENVMPWLSSLGISLTGEASSPRKMVQVLDRLLTERLHCIPHADPLTAYAVRTMTRDISCTRVGTLTNHLGVSQKRLERTLKHQTGLTPKKMGRTVRFVSSIRALTAAPDRPLADLALALGFTDQAHFNREFKSLSGLSPTRWLRERTDVDFLQYTPVSLI